MHSHEVWSSLVDSCGAIANKQGWVKWTGLFMDWGWARITTILKFEGITQGPKKNLGRCQKKLIKKKHTHTHKHLDP